VRRVLEEAPLQLMDMRWDERWAEVVFSDPEFGLEELRQSLLRAAAYCAPWSREMTP